MDPRVREMQATIAAAMASAITLSLTLAGCAFFRSPVKYDVSMQFDSAGLVERKYCRAPADSLDWECYAEKCTNAGGTESCEPRQGNPEIRVAYLKQSGAVASRNPAEESHYSRLQSLKENCEAKKAIEGCVEYYDAIRMDRTRTAEMAEVRERICRDERVRCEEKRSRQTIRVQPTPGCELSTLRVLPEPSALASASKNTRAKDSFEIVDLGAAAPERACDALLEDIYRQRKPLKDSPLSAGEKLLVRREQWTVSFPKKRPVGTLSTRVERIILKKTRGPKPASAH